ncbi:MAG: ABC transporter substrate-binding protein, partial [Proteobacteria bacterium]|nr:ABC transporter substrate-binding protein [Pseudomonadota bacterium]
MAAAGLPAMMARAATSINYLGWEGYDTFLEGGDYLAKNDVAMQKTYIATPDEIITKLRLGADQIDVCTPYFIHDDFLASEGLLEPLDLAKIPNFNSLMPEVVKQSEASMTTDDRWYAAPMTWGTICMMYNADRVAEAPTSWTDMLKDEFKGKCAITNDYPGNLWAWARVATGVEEPHFMTYEQLDQTVEALINLKKNHLRTIASSYGEMIDLLAREEVLICQGWEPVATWVGESPTIKPVYPIEG